MVKIDDYKNDVPSQWCPGCPNFGILNALKTALAALGKQPHECCLVSGIGQAAKLPHYLKCNFFNGLHGRALPAALGIHVANPRLTTIVVTGEGDCYGEGGNHFLHALRRNPDITVVVHNNGFYALTKGQASPTTRLGEKRSLQISGVEIAPLNMPAIAIVHDCTLVARGFAGDGDHLKSLLMEAVSHPGLSVVEVIQPCITWGTHPLSWYRERVYILGDDYDPTDRKTALEKTMETGERIPTGILFRAAPRKPFADRFRKEITDRPFAELTPVSPEKMAGFLSDLRKGYMPEDDSHPPRIGT
ncbi:MULTISPECIES: thiamine pyrophosphate-dependent enzyme [Desulfococcus]|jgi:2-oxoglutarate ferredoxin oxidoreductase subunit beta|uniref:Pyruvate ferredoxin/flavodoxin oxidoreductase, beta subunit n=1 Tax=Desulfococcus multivorans DSM 2059 TaxID=1121405 RepID=S7TB06_DESML|nr:thiamine pyrophosphate-dependent enzyme [Desulfococcus multivorans]AOY56974.1 KorB1: 2-oxoglutarate synthase, subunit beta [Desulfococcus multivorans]AQU99494.1 2-oxoacid ferredoxin oxidoreductase [Desulfococcus multivorans]EPR34302.1 pyruvate ferredoxin/flavodoxin oxidoreductase, beta subunit [Desulfococcus multivorans DSM 2059]SJZ90418.1 2-oxoglutarate ferredoxin oxidoreductase subunit beta [Desulfococcus multivorans DSM 2059]